MFWSVSPGWPLAAQVTHKHVWDDAVTDRLQAVDAALSASDLRPRCSSHGSHSGACFGELNVLALSISCFMLYAARSAIAAVGKQAAAQDCMIPQTVLDEQQAVVATMEQHGLVSVQDGGTFLSSLAIATVLQLSGGVPSADGSEPTALELRHALQQCGWEMVDVAATCSVSEKRMMRVQCRGYFKLLKQTRSQLQALTEQNAFSHSQRQRYYDAVSQLCAARPFASWSATQICEQCMCAVCRCVCV